MLRNIRSLERKRCSVFFFFFSAVQQNLSSCYLEPLSSATCFLEWAKFRINFDYRHTFLISRRRRFGLSIDVSIRFQTGVHWYREVPLCRANKQLRSDASRYTISTVSSYQLDVSKIFNYGIEMKYINVANFCQSCGCVCVRVCVWSLAGWNFRIGNRELGMHLIIIIYFLRILKCAILIFIFSID